MKSVQAYKSIDGRIFLTREDCENHENELAIMATYDEYVDKIRNKLVEVEGDIEELINSYPQFGSCLFIDNSRIGKPIIGFKVKKK